MNFTINRWLQFGFALAIFFVLAVGVISYTTVEREVQESELVKKTYRVINQLTTVQKILIDMETGRRGFRSTDEKQYLQPYHVGLQQMEPEFKVLNDLIRDNAGQRKRAALIKSEIDGLILFWRNNGDESMRLSKEDIGKTMTIEKAAMDKIRAGITEMVEYENDLLNEREKANNSIIEEAKWRLVAGIFLILCIVVLLIFKIVNEFKNRLNAEANLKKNLKELSVLNQENAERSWLMAGLAKVNDSLQGQLTSRELAEIVLNAVIKYLDMKAGAFYVFDETSKTLQLAASYALPDIAKTTYALHEGFVGQAAVETEPLVLFDIPPRHAKVEGATIHAEPVQGIYTPLHQNGELKGVMELLSFKPVGQSVIKLLQVVTNNISVALNSAIAREKKRQLLQLLQQQKETLEHQQEELRQTNEELTVQAEVLQSSEEELRVQEEELRQINAELKEKNQAIESAREELTRKAKELETASKYKSEFLANMSHELRTPLNSVLILAKLLANNKEHNLTEKQVAHADIIYRSGSDLLDLINDILDLSKIEAGKVNINLENTFVKSIADDLEQMFTMVAEEKGIRYTVIVEEDVPDTIFTDKQKVEQVLKNLLSNAFKFTPKDGNIQLKFENDVSNGTDYVKMSVTDNGIGIPAAKQQVIFEAFAQVDGSINRKFGGTGLGLSISKELMRILKGKISVTSEEGEGSAFTIFVPVKADESEDKKPTVIRDTKVAAEPVEIRGSQPPVGTTDKTILIIEDDENFATVIKDFALSNGYKAVITLTGEDGLEYAQKHTPSAIILDLQLPGMNGATLLKTLKSDPALQHIPVHVISAYDNPLVEEAGAIAFLKKPVDEAELNAAFSLIGKYLQKAVTRVLILSEDRSREDELCEQIREKKLEIVCETASSVTEVLAKLEKGSYDCIIADIGNNIETGISRLKFLNAHLLPHRIPVIIYLDNDVTLENEMDLKKISNVVVRKSSLSNNRLLEELELFLHKVQSRHRNTYPAFNKVVLGDVALENKKVLLVDDDMRNIFALSAALEEEKMEVKTASNGKEAIEFLEKNKDVDIVLMDIMMPEMDGYEAMNYIRKTLQLTSLPVIALTAKAMANDREKCMEAGASDYISKPVDLKKLISLMKVWLS